MTYLASGAGRMKSGRRGRGQSTTSPSQASTRRPGERRWTTSYKDCRCSSRIYVKPSGAVQSAMNTSTWCGLSGYILHGELWRARHTRMPFCTASVVYAFSPLRRFSKPSCKGCDQNTSWHVRGRLSVPTTEAFRLLGASTLLVCGLCWKTG